MPSPDATPRSILFVCLGNICRSPLAEGVFRDLARSAGIANRYEVDSAGTGGWHVGERPDPRSVEVALRNGIRLEGSARRLEPSDFDRFDLIVAMDEQNRLDAHEIGQGQGARIRLLREFDPEATDDLDVPDPYYGGPDGFERVFDMVHRSCSELLDHLEGGPHR